MVYLVVDKSKVIKLSRQIIPEQSDEVDISKKTRLGSLQATGFGTSPLQKTVWRYEGLKLLWCAPTLPLTYRHKMNNQCSNYSLKMEITEIFQKDGKLNCTKPISSG